MKSQRKSGQPSFTGEIEKADPLGLHCKPCFEDRKVFIDAIERRYPHPTATFKEFEEARRIVAEATPPDTEGQPPA